MHELATADGWVTDSDIQSLRNSDDVCTMSVRRGGDMAFGEKAKNFKQVLTSVQKPLTKARKLPNPTSQLSAERVPSANAV